MNINLDYVYMTRKQYLDYCKLLKELEKYNDIKLINDNIILINQ
jgi:hypothetical protein